MCYFVVGGFSGYEFPDMNKYEAYFPWQQTQQHISPQSRYWARSQKRALGPYPPQNDPAIHVTLENKGIMAMFDRYCTEMIITKTGR